MRNLLAVGLLMVVCGAAMGQAITGGEPTEVEKLRSEITRLKAENSKLAARVKELEGKIASETQKAAAATMPKKQGVPKLSMKVGDLLDVAIVVKQHTPTHWQMRNFEGREFMVRLSWDGTAVNTFYEINPETGKQK